MRWDKGYKARYYCTRVDPATWRDVETYDITDGRVTKRQSDTMETASVNMTDIPFTGEKWIRIWLDARQESSGAREPLFTGLASVPGLNWNGHRKECALECYSVLKPMADVLMQKGWYAAAGMNGAQLVASLLSIGAAPVTYDENSPILSESIVAENKESNLSMAQKILSAIGWRIRISGDGWIHICPKAEGPIVTFDSLEYDMLETEISDKQDLFSVPNVFRATSRKMTATIRDEDPNNIYSTICRGREVWKEELNAKLSNGESIEEYVSRRLKEEQQPARICSYARRFHPDAVPGDVIRLSYPAQNIEGDFQIDTQRIDLGFAARTAESVSWKGNG